MRWSRFFLSPLAFTLLALPMAAQEAHFGIQGALSFPSGDLSDGADLGLQVGAHVRWNLGQGHGIMARADVTSYGDKDGFSTSSTALAGDYTYHFSRTPRGFYVLAGLGLQDYHQSYQGYSTSSSGLGFDLGVGLDLDRHVGLQARMTSLSADNSTFTALNLGVTYTF